MKLWDRYWHGDVAAVRPWLLHRGVLLLLAFDTWIVMAYHGGRYGVGGFNVAHFRLLGELQPLPTPALYVGVVLLCGLLALAQVFARPNRIALSALFVLYTWSWAMSMLDSYQHHYLLSLLLLSMIFFPRLGGRELFGATDGAPAPHSGGTEGRSEKRTPADEGARQERGKRGSARGGKNKKARRRAARRAKRAQRKPQGPSTGAATTSPGADSPDHSGTRRSPRHISAWAYPSFLVTCAIVYGYTAVAKTEPDWRRGHALRRLTSGNETASALEEFFTAQLGLGPDGFWELVAISVILLQILICSGYGLAVRRDTLRARATRLYCWVALGGALSFHVGAEILDLRIGWFSYYMILVALIVMLPERPLWIVGRAASWPARRLGELWATWSRHGGRKDEPFSVGVLGASVALVAGLLGYLVDLPGALYATIVFAVGWTALAVHRSVVDGARQGHVWTAAMGLSALAMWASFATTDVRFDYYRMVGGDARRRGEYERALAAYVKANRYAPRDPPLQARAAGDCDRSLGYRWNGDECVELRGCECEGPDCHGLADDESACEESFAGHRDDKEQALRRRLGRE